MFKFIFIIFLLKSNRTQQKATSSFISRTKQLMSVIVWRKVIISEEWITHSKNLSYKGKYRSSEEMTEDKQ